MIVIQTKKGEKKGVQGKKVAYAEARGKKA